MSKINLYIKRKVILEESKKYILKNGWNNNIFKSISKNKKFKNEEVTLLFPEGYKSLLVFYLEELNIKMTDSSKSLNLVRMKTHKRIREIILLRLKINQDEKNLIKKTYFTLLLPQHSKIASMSLYKIVDQMWFIAGDKSTDFNFYSKRAILAAIYSSTFFYWINNQDFKKTVQFLDLQLKKISKIPKIKKRIKNLTNFLPKIFKILKIVSPSMR